MSYPWPGQGYTGDYSSWSSSPPQQPHAAPQQRYYAAPPQQQYYVPLQQQQQQRPLHQLAAPQPQQLAAPPSQQQQVYQHPQYSQQQTQYGQPLRPYPQQTAPYAYGGSQQPPAPYDGFQRQALLPAPQQPPVPEYSRPPYKPPNPVSAPSNSGYQRPLQPSGAPQKALPPGFQIWRPPPRQDRPGQSESKFQVQPKEDAHQPQHSAPQQPSTPPSTGQTQNTADPVAEVMVDNVAEELRKFKSDVNYKPQFPDKKVMEALEKSAYGEKLLKLKSEFSQLQSQRQTKSQPSQGREQPATELPASRGAQQTRQQRRSDWGKVDHSKPKPKSRFAEIQEQLAAGRRMSDLASTKYTPNPPGSKRRFPGLLPFMPFVPRREVRPGDFHVGKDKDGRPNQIKEDQIPQGTLGVNKMHLNKDEDQRACYVTYATESQCPHGADCPNNHNVPQAVLQWLVNYRDLPPSVANTVIYFANCNPPPDMKEKYEEIKGKSTLRIYGNMSAPELQRRLQEVQRSTRAPRPNRVEKSTMSGKTKSSRMIDVHKRREGRPDSRGC